MRTLALFCTIILSLVLLNCGGNTGSNTTTASTAGSVNNPVVTGSTLFEQAWTDFDQNYSYFMHKNIDWNCIFIENIGIFYSIFIIDFLKNLRVFSAYVLRTLICAWGSIFCLLT